MEDKKQDVNSLQELVKAADSYRTFFANLADGLSKVLADIKAPDEEENKWEMTCPYKDGDRFYIVNPKGSVKYVFWNNCDSNKKTFNQGNIFPTKKAAKLESRRRNLLTRFRSFRDECNGDWKSDYKDVTQKKYYVSYSEIKNSLYVSYIVLGNHLHTFGYFKNEEDAERAIELFGDEIEELFVECE